MLDHGPEFDSELANDSYPTGIENHYWSIARAKIISEAIDYAERFGIRKTSGRILEVGCGPGVVVKALRSMGYDVFGCELGTPVVRNEVKQYIKTGVFAENLDFSFRKSIETILLLDVIEHIQNDSDFLRHLLQSFPNCNSVIVIVPARPEVWSNYDSYYRHYRRYTTTSLKLSINSSGLSSISMRYFFFSLYLAALMLKTLRIKRQVRLNTPGYPSIHRLVSAFLEIEGALSRRLDLVGLSLMCIAQRQERPIENF